MLYHVSKTTGLTVLEPQVSTHGKAYVYAIEDLITGLLFGAKKDDFDFLLNTTQNGLPEIFECYPDAFRSIYQGKSCSVYELKEDGFLRGMTSWTPELVCETPVTIEQEIAVPDLYHRLLQAEADGQLIIHRYRQDPEYKAFISRHIVDRLIRFHALDYIKTDTRFQNYFGKIIKELQHIMDGHLLD